MRPPSAARGRGPRAIALLGVVLFAGVPALAAAGDPVRPTPSEKCPVCGMFVAKYPDWTASVVYADGSHAVFDGPKDLFKFYLEPRQFASARTRHEFQAIFVTDYYAVRPIDARTAYFVLGSDVYGPMGRELVPFEKLSDAEEFLKDHRGNRILRFEEVGPAILALLE